MNKLEAKIAEAVRAYSNQQLEIVVGAYAPEEPLTLTGVAKEITLKVRSMIEGAGLTDEQIEEAKGIYIPPTKEAWEIKPDHRYWQDKRILWAQLQAILSNLEG